MDYEIKAEFGDEGAHEGTFIEWHKKIGDSVSAGETIAEMMTDKANIELESPADGIMHSQSVTADDKIGPDTVLGIVRGS